MVLIIPGIDDIRIEFSKFIIKVGFLLDSDFIQVDILMQSGRQDHFQMINCDFLF